MATRGEKLEAEFQSNLIKKLKVLINDGVDGFVINFDGSYIQGFPDILILYKGRWAALECKRSSCAEYQPNQEYYLELLNDLSFASVIYPANEDEVLDDLCKALRNRRRRPRIS